MLKEKLLEELNRYKAINVYAEKLIFEQEAPDPNEDPNAPAGPVPPADPNAVPEEGGGAIPPADAEAGGAGLEGEMGGGAGAIPPAPGGEGEAAPVPASGEPVEPTAGAEDSTEELDITDLVNMTKNIKQSMEQKTDENTAVNQKMDGIFTKLGELETRLGEMDQLLSKIDELGGKIEQMKPPTPVEKLEMRSLDSYPFNQNPSQFFNEKRNEMRASGKNEYVLTKDDVKNYSQSEIRNSFNPDGQEYNAVKY